MKTRSIKQATEDGNLYKVYQADDRGWQHSVGLFPAAESPQETLGCVKAWCPKKVRLGMTVEVSRITKCTVGATYLTALPSLTIGPSDFVVIQRLARKLRRHWMIRGCRRTLKMCRLKKLRPSKSALRPKS